MNALLNRYDQYRFSAEIYIFMGEWILEVERMTYVLDVKKAYPFFQKIFKNYPVTSLKYHQMIFIDLNNMEFQIDFLSEDCKYRSIIPLQNFNFIQFLKCFTQIENVIHPCTNCTDEPFDMKNLLDMKYVKKHSNYLELLHEDTTRIGLFTHKSRYLTKDNKPLPMDSYDVPYEMVYTPPCHYSNNILLLI